MQHVCLGTWKIKVVIAALKKLDKSALASFKTMSLVKLRKVSNELWLTLFNTSQATLIIENPIVKVFS